MNESFRVLGTYQTRDELTESKFIYGLTARDRCLKNYLKGEFANNKRGYRLTPN